jgi:hypothetical protein
MLKNKLSNFALVLAVAVVAFRLFMFIEKRFFPPFSVGQCFFDDTKVVKFEILKNDYLNGKSQLRATTYGVTVDLEGTFEELKELSIIKGECNEATN